MKRIIIFACLLLSCFHEKIIIDNTRDYLAFTRRQYGPYNIDIWLVNVTTGEEIPVADYPNYLENTPTWFNDHELLFLFEKSHSSGEWLGHLNFQTGNRTYTAVETPGGLSAGSTMSIDSLKNIYCAVSDNAIGLLTLKKGKFEYRNILSYEDLKSLGIAELEDPQISPDGSRLLLEGCDTTVQRLDIEKKMGSHNDIYIYDMTVDNKKDALCRLTDDIGEFDDENPSWFDNDRFLFSSDRDGNKELYIMDLSKMEIERLTHTEEVRESNPVLSPDGKLIAYTVKRNQPGNTEIWIMDITTRESKYITKGYGPCWSPLFQIGGQ